MPKHHFVIPTEGFRPEWRDLVFISVWSIDANTEAIENFHGTIKRKVPRFGLTPSLGMTE